MRAMVLLLAALLLPGALAAAPTSVHGAMVFGAPPTLEGHARVSAMDGVVDLTGPALDGVPLRLAWGAASAKVHESPWTYVVVADQESRSRTDPQEWSHRFGRATLTDVRCGPACAVALFPAPGARLDVEAAADAALALTTGPATYAAEIVAGEERRGAFDRAVPEGALLLAVGDGWSGASATWTGDAVLLLRDATATIVPDEGAPVTLDARNRREERASVLGQSAGEVRSRFALVTLRDVAPLDVGEGALVLASNATVDADGWLRADDATGTLREGDRTRALDGDALALDGAFRLTLRLDDGGGLALTGPEATRATLAGDARAVWIAGARVQETPVAAAAPLALGLVALLFAAWALYSRLDRTRILAHPHRQHIYGLVAAEPGLTPSEASRRLGLARMVVKHHLGVLERHALVGSRAAGRTRRYFLAHDPAALRRALMENELGDETRRRIARELVSPQGPLTQSELATRIGVGPRLVSYHLSRLEAAGLVVVQGAWRRKYHAADELRAALHDASENTRAESA